MSTLILSSKQELIDLYGATVLRESGHINVCETVDVFIASNTFGLMATLKKRTQ